MHTHFPIHIRMYICTHIKLNKGYFKCLKVSENIGVLFNSYTMGMSGLLDIIIYPQPLGFRCIYQANHECTWYNCYVTLYFYVNGFTIYVYSGTNCFRLWVQIMIFILPFQPFFC